MLPIDPPAPPPDPYRGPRPPRDGLRIVFAGIPSDYGTAFLLHLLEHRANVVALLCSTRWQRTYPKPDLLSRIATHVGLPVEVATSLKGVAAATRLQRFHPDLVVMASFDQILGDPVLKVPRLEWMNIHPSLLPRHRGPEPIYWTIAQGDREAGISLHRTTLDIDAGPILAQRRVKVAPTDTSGTLCKRLVSAGLTALEQTLGRLASGGLHAATQDLRKGSYELPVPDTDLDWKWPYARIDRLVRAGRPDHPPAFTFRGERRYAMAVRRLGRREGQAPGRLEEGPEGDVLAATQDAQVAVGWRRVAHI